MKAFMAKIKKGEIIGEMASESQDRFDVEQINKL